MRRRRPTVITTPPASKLFASAPALRDSVRVACCAALRTFRYKPGTNNYVSFVCSCVCNIYYTTTSNGTTYVHKFTKFTACLYALLLCLVLTITSRACRYRRGGKKRRVSIPEDIEEPITNTSDEPIDLYVRLPSCCVKCTDCEAWVVIQGQRRRRRRRRRRHK